MNCVASSGRTMKKRTFLVSYRTVGEQVFLVKNCKSKAEAKRKLMEFRLIDGGDLEAISHEIVRSYPEAAKVSEYMRRE